MAITNIKKNVNELLYRNEASSAITFNALVALSSTNDADIYTATTKTYGVSFEAVDRDDKYVILVKNGGNAAAKVYVKGSDNPMYGADIDLEINVPVGTIALTVDSANYAQYKAEGHRKGEIILLGNAATIEVAVIKLP